MSLCFQFLVLSLLLSYALQGCSAFSVIPSSTGKGHRAGKTSTCLANSAAETEVERLLRRARELKNEAAAEEQALHETLLDKKTSRDAQTDVYIDQLFPSSNLSPVQVSKRIQELKYSTDTLERIVERLHEREIAARGLEYVEPCSGIHQEQMSFRRVSQEDAEELARVEGLIDLLVDAADVMDEEYLRKKNVAPQHLNHGEIEHWTVGECGAILRTKIKELRRGHDQQFLDRLQEFYDAQRKKDLPPPSTPPMKK